jgi:hypothetical protein
MDITNLKLQKLYVFIKLIKQFKYNNNSSNLDELLNNDIFNSINKEIYIPSNIQDVCNGDLNTDIKNGILHFKTILPEYEGLLNKILINEPNIEVVLPVYNIFNSNSKNKYFNKLQTLTDFGSQNTSKRYNLEITHYILDYRKNNLYSGGDFMGLYYHNPENKNTKIIEDIQNILLKILKSEKDRLKKMIEADSKLSQEQLNELSDEINENRKRFENINKNIQNLESGDFWIKPRYFIINKIDFKINKKNLYIETFNSMLSKKGGGHLLLCILIYLFLDKMKSGIQEVTLEAGSENVITKFYKPKGFICSYRSLKCEGDITKLKKTCVDIPDIKLILIYNNNYVNNLETMISLINS